MKPKLTKDLVAKAIKLKGHGLSNKDICTAVGVSEAALYKWMQDGGKTQLQIELVEGLKKAEANFKDALLRNILKQGEEKDWKAHAWVLERKYPSEFGRVDRLQAEVAQTTEANVVITYAFDYGDDENGGE